MATQLSMRKSSKSVTTGQAGETNGGAQWIDISIPVTESLPVWPGSRPFQAKITKEIEKGDICNESEIALNVHTGTHIDAPMHFLQNGTDIGFLPVDTFIGPAAVVEVATAGDIGAEVLESLSLPSRVPRILLKTPNSNYWRQNTLTFHPEFSALTDDGAKWLVSKGFQLVGIDYLSIQRYGRLNGRVHQILFEGGVTILEGVNLSNAAGGIYHLICLPLRLLGREASPVRAVIRPLQASTDHGDH